MFKLFLVRLLASFPLLEGCPFSCCYILHVFEFTSHTCTICLYAWVLQFYPFFTRISAGWVAKHLLTFFLQSVHSQTRLLLDFLSPPWLILWMAHVKSNNVWIGRVEAWGFHSSWSTVYLCVVHHSTWIMLSNLCFIIGLWLAQQHFSPVFLCFSSLPILLWWKWN